MSEAKIIQQAQIDTGSDWRTEVNSEKKESALSHKDEAERWECFIRPSVVSYILLILFR